MEDQKIDFSKYNMETIGYQEADEIKETHLDDSSEAMLIGRDILEEARLAWDNLEGFRNRRTTARKYYRGDHWHKRMTDPDSPSETIREDEYILRQGRKPIKINQIRQLVKNVLGQFRENDFRNQARARKPEHAALSEVMTNGLGAVYDHNDLKELDVRVFEEFMISGCFCWKEHYGWIAERDTDDVIVDTPHTTRLFWNSDVVDPRGKDIRLIGETHDLTLNEVLKAFSLKPGDREKIIEWYGNIDKSPGYQDLLEADQFDSMDFLVPHDGNKIKVIEVWKKKLAQKVIAHDMLEGEMYQMPGNVQEAIAELEAENESRLMAAAEQGVLPEMVPLIEYEVKEEDVWCYYYLTPEGKILDAGETPYEHQTHPYTIGLYPLVDGEVWGFIEDIIDQQDGINRYFSMLDWMLGTSAKGVLIFPEELMPEGWDKQDVGREWVKANGVIITKPNAQATRKPEQITSQAQSVAGKDLLMYMSQMLKEVSGVTEAIQGQKPAAGTPSSLYAQMVNNASLASKDYFEFFFAKLATRDHKIIQLMLQFYDGQRYVNTSGKDYDNEAYILDADEIRNQDAKFDIVIARGANSPMYRMVIDDYLYNFLQGGMIDLPMFLENTSLPFADKLLQQFQERQAAMEAQAAEMGVVPGQEQPQGGGKIQPQAQQLLQQAFQLPKPNTAPLRQTA